MGALVKSDETKASWQMTNETSGGNTFNFDKVEQNVTGDGSVGQIGDNDATVTNNFDQTAPEWKAPLIDLQKQVENLDWHEAAPEEITTLYGQPAMLMGAAIDQAEADIQQSQSQPESDSSHLNAEEFEEKKTNWYQRFSSLLPLGVKIAASVGSAVVGTYVKKSPVIAGLQALFSEVQNLSD